MFFFIPYLNSHPSLSTCSIKFIGYNPLLLAVLHGCDIELIDNLLGKSVSPAERDQIKGYVVLMTTFLPSNFLAQLEHISFY